MRSIIEIGKTQAAVDKSASYGAYFSAFYSGDNDVIISDPFNHQIIIVNRQKQITKKVSLENQWFPRWAMPYEGKVFFIDRNNSSIGFILGDEVFSKKIIDMDVLLSASISFSGNLIVCGRGANAVIEIGKDLEEIDRYFDSSYSVQSAQIIDKNKFLLCDNIKHQVYICDSAGHVFWNHGKSYEPGDYDDELSTPKYACKIDDKIYIVDGMNNRIKVIDFNSGVVEKIISSSANRPLWMPTCIDVKNEAILICDSFNERVVEIKDNGEIEWEYGQPFNKVSFELNNPRIFDMKDNLLYVANSYNNNITEIDYKGNIKGMYGGNRELLFWPKSVKALNDGSFLVADSRNGRILHLDNCYNVVKHIDHYVYKNVKLNFLDPHDVDQLEDGSILITDALRNIVVNITWDGALIWIYGINSEIKDPHQCRCARDGNFILSDTGNHRIIKIDSDGHIIMCIHNTSKGALFRPRWCEELEYNSLLITDSGNNRIIHSDNCGIVDYQFGNEYGNSVNNLREPRCAKLINGVLFISDTINNRLLKVEGELL